METPFPLQPLNLYQSYEREVIFIHSFSPGNKRVEEVIGESLFAASRWRKWDLNPFSLTPQLKCLMRHEAQTSVQIRSIVLPPLFPLVHPSVSLINGF